MVTFVGPDTLAELVWSSRAGLSIKLSNKKPGFMLEADPSNIGFLRSEINITEGCSVDENDENDEVESHRSTESCRRNKSSIKRKRKSNFEQQLILESKRIKKQADSSFINCLSNMVKGLKDHENYDREISFHDENRIFESGKTGYENVFESLFSVGSSKETDLANKYSNESLDCLKLKAKSTEGFAKNISLYEKVTKESPKAMFDTIRRLRLSRKDIIKWTDSQSSVVRLDGFYVRLRLAKCKEGKGGSRYYVACITGFQGENSRKGFKKPIRVKIKGVECFVESQYISNCEFLEEELVAWLHKTTSKVGIPLVKDLKSKLDERNRLGL